MRFTRRRRDPRAALALLLCVPLGVASVASCSSSDAGIEAPSGDAAIDAPPVDASIDDAARPRDAGWTDAGPRPVVCEGSPCAIALVATSGAGDTDASEGYCALLNDGTVACWGANAAGQLGRGNDFGEGTDDSSRPARVPGVRGVVALEHTCAVDGEGAAWCWGTGPFLRSETQATTTERVAVKLPLAPIAQLGIGTSTGCAAIRDGSFVCWGGNRSGQVVSVEPDPFVVHRVYPATPIRLPAGAPVRSVHVGKATLVVRDDGTAISWGANPPLGRLSSMPFDGYPRPIPIVGISTLDVTVDEASATAGGVGYRWGAVPAFVWSASSERDRALPEPAVAPEPIVDLATTRSWVTTGVGDPIVELSRWCAVGVGGNAYCWGLNEAGQAGTGTKSHVFTASRVVGLPAPVARIRAMTRSTCALLTTGKIFCWGSNMQGQLGDGEPKGASVVPHQVILP